MTIRLANVGDVPRVLELLADAHPESPIAPYAPFSEAMSRTELLGHLGSSNSLCLVHEAAGAVQGIFIAFASIYPCSPVHLGVERVRWVDPKHRGVAWFKMKRWFESWAKERGCVAVSLSSKNDARFESAIARDGYEFAEAHYVKKL